MSDTVVVMNDGRILQQGTPQDVYNEPANAFVADFIGESNIVPGIMHEDYLVEFCTRNFTCVDKGFAPDEPVEVVIRPEDIKIVAQDAQLFGEVRSVIFKGVHYEMNIVGDNFSFLVHSTLSEPVGTRVGLLVVPNDLHIMHKSERGGLK
jgi:spermidine/putrescine transport system ATP-binding protein